MASTRIAPPEIDEMVERSEKSIVWKGITIKIQPTLSLADALGFVRSVVDSCFATDTQEYQPEMKDFMGRVATMQLCTDYKLPESVEEKYDFVYRSGLYERVFSSLNLEQFNVLWEAINSKIANRAQGNIQALTKQMNEVTAQVAEIGTSLTELFDGLDNESLKGIVNAFANGSLDEDRLVNAVVQRKSNMAAI